MHQQVFYQPGVSFQGQPRSQGLFRKKPWERVIAKLQDKSQSNHGHLLWNTLPGTVDLTTQYTSYRAITLIIISRTG